MDSIAIFFSDEKNLEKVIVHCKNNDFMGNIFEKFALNVPAKVSDFNFYYKGKKIKPDTTIMKLKNSQKATDIDISYKKRSKIMKCPECVCNNCIIKIDKYRLNFSECCHGHIINDQIFDKYEQSQNIEFDKIICHKCQKSQKDDIKDFSKCLKCSKKFKYAIYYCSECSSSHHHAQQLIKYDEKYYYCQDHFKLFKTFCVSCNQNLCEICEKSHLLQACKLKKFEQMIPDVNQIKIKLEEIKENIEDLKIIVDQIKNNMDGAVRIMERYYVISYDIINKYESFNQKFKNYQVLKTVSFLTESNERILQKLKEITESDGDLREKCNILIGIYKDDRENYLNNNGRPKRNLDNNKIINNNSINVNERINQSEINEDDSLSRQNSKNIRIYNQKKHISNSITKKK